MLHLCRRSAGSVRLRCARGLSANPYDLTPNPYDLTDEHNKAAAANKTVAVNNAEPAEQPCDGAPPVYHSCAPDHRGYDPVTVISTPEEAAKLCEQLMSLPKHTMHACDTEVMNFDITKGPIGNGTVTCMSIYSGPELDFGNGPRVWIDNLDGAAGTLEAMAPFLEDPSCKKIWHNYSFDRHELWNHGIDCKGLGGDTMHMARCWNSALEKYSLAYLTAGLLPDDDQRKRTMKERFGHPKIKKDGTDGKVRATGYTHWRCAAGAGCLNRHASLHLNRRASIATPQSPRLNRHASIATPQSH
jgi:hypothetical protein